nr:unnamed protein product [Spirometra erinaceieuropaei]
MRSDAPGAAGPPLGSTRWVISTSWNRSSSVPRHLPFSVAADRVPAADGHGYDWLNEGKQARNSAVSIYPQTLSSPLCYHSLVDFGLICSADQYWYRESGGQEYRYDPLQLDDAHSFCYQNALDCASRGVSPLVIDNTNIRLWECRCYLDLARKFDYNVILVTPKTPWRFDVNTLVSRNVHNVPPSIIESKVRQFEPVYPLYYGWFWAGQQSCRVEEQALPSGTGNKVDSFPFSETEAMIASSFRSFLALLNLPTVRKQLAQMCGFSPVSAH